MTQPTKLQCKIAELEARQATLAAEYERAPKHWQADLMHAKRLQDESKSIDGQLLLLRPLVEEDDVVRVRDDANDRRPAACC